MVRSTYVHSAGVGVIIGDVPAHTTVPGPLSNQALGSSGGQCWVFKIRLAPRGDTDNTFNVILEIIRYGDPCLPATPACPMLTPTPSPFVVFYRCRLSVKCLLSSVGDHLLWTSVMLGAEWDPCFLPCAIQGRSI